MKRNGAGARGEVIAGLTVWAVLIPEALAYATIAGVSPVVGLYAAVPALLLYAVLGSSRQLIVGPMSTTAVLSAGIIATQAHAGTTHFVALTTTLALVTGGSDCWRACCGWVSWPTSYLSRS